MKSTLSVILLCCAMLLALALLFARRAEQPETYPDYSSYRTLPEGASILYEALDHFPGMTASRNIHPLSAAHLANSAVLLLGLLPANVDFDAVEQLASQGNRVIIGFLPHRARFVQPHPGQLDDPLKYWNLRLDFFRASDFRRESEGTLTPGWPMYFSQSAGWDALRKENGKPVVIQKAKGKGAIVLLANSYLLSNEAMVDDRQTAFVTGLIGPVHQTVFDETHFGIEESGSIAALARRYHLQGFALGLMVVAALFLWKSAAGFPPVPSELQLTGDVAGEAATASFLNLLRRNIRPDDILSICVAEWRKMYQRKAGDRLQTAIDLAESGRKTPAQTYLAIQRILETKHHPS